MNRAQIAEKTHKTVMQSAKNTEKQLAKGWLFSLTTQGSITINDPSLL